MFFSSKSIRMCISCRKKIPQQELLRLVHRNYNFNIFNGIGRSFYFCKECLTDEKAILKSLSKFKGLKQKEERLKEIQEIAKRWKK